LAKSIHPETEEYLKLLEEFTEEIRNAALHFESMGLVLPNLQSLYNAPNIPEGPSTEIGCRVVSYVCEKYLLQGLQEPDILDVLTSESMSDYAQNMNEGSPKLEELPPSPKVPSKSRRCTTDLLEYLRFFKSYTALATEVKYNACSSDVLALSSSGKTVSEFEVKVSKGDFKKDFTKTLGYARYGATMSKHSSYNDEESTRFAPHYFWFVVPLEMADFALKHLEDYPHYGLLSWDKEGVSIFSRRRPLNTKICVVKPALLIKKVKRPRAAIETLAHKILMRATSELVKLRMKELGKV